MIIIDSVVFGFGTELLTMWILVGLNLTRFACFCWLSSLTFAFNWVLFEFDIGFGFLVTRQFTFNTGERLVPSDGVLTFRPLI